MEKGSFYPFIKICNIQKSSMKKIILLSFAILTIMAACKNTPKPAEAQASKLPEGITQEEPAPKDETLKATLEEAGIPFKLTLPEGTKIKSMKGKMAKGAEGLTMLYNQFDDYYINISEKTGSISPSAEKAAQLTSLKKLKNFVKVVKEEADGFIYEIKNPGESLYGFVFVKQNNGTNYVFQQGNYQPEGMDKIETMFNSVKDSK
jgi:hypothetical protein